MLRLPVSGIDVALRHPDGADDLLLHEAAGPAVAVALALLPRLAGPGDWAALCVTDFEVLLLGLRAQVLGEQFALGMACPGCGERMEIAFRRADFLRGITPRRSDAVVATTPRSGWFALDGAAFRLPTAGDQAAIAGERDPARRLAERCLDPAGLTGPVRRRIERAMAVMAPAVSRPVAGNCPACGSAVSATLHVTRLVVDELRRAAAAVHDEVDLLARTYHWPESTILALPQVRRRAYAERIRGVRLEAA